MSWTNWKTSEKKRKLYEKTSAHTPLRKWTLLSRPDWDVWFSSLGPKSRTWLWYLSQIPYSRTKVDHWLHKLECKVVLCRALLHPQLRVQVVHEKNFRGWKKNWPESEKNSKWHETSRNGKNSHTHTIQTHTHTHHTHSHTHKQTHTYIHAGTTHTLTCTHTNMHTYTDLLTLTTNIHKHTHRDIHPHRPTHHKHTYTLTTNTHKHSPQTHTHNTNTLTTNTTPIHTHPHTQTQSTHSHTREKNLNYNLVQTGIAGWATGTSSQPHSSLLPTVNLPSWAWTPSARHSTRKIQTLAAILISLFQYFCKFKSEKVLFCFDTGNPKWTEGKVQFGSRQVRFLHLLVCFQLRQEKNYSKVFHLKDLEFCLQVVRFPFAL